MGDLTGSLTPSSGALNLVTTASSHNPRPMPVREDCWSEEATSTLVDAWGRRYLELNRGNLRQKDWQDVADAVNALHGQTKKTHRTDVQCKNRVDTIKKKYKIEKARVSASNGNVTSSWPFYDRMDVLIGSSVSVKKQPSPSLSPSPPVALPLTYRKSPSSAPPTAVALPQKRPADDGYFRRNYSAMAAAAAAESDESEEDEREREREEESEEEGEGMRKLARAIERFGEVYERVEGEKLRQMVELEKQRMQFAKDLEVQRMTMFMDTQVQLEKVKRGKHSGSDDIYS
ncbi:trihelix transcription factor ASIL2-like isoform X2 [Tripterygium wilfordii]|uniref:trihelix transcription factor ASIL2-like isoform X2 n=1 Tax=Tripterygium wilfordii TaxID=458696 RepID=UPI0018F7F88A|nr:trihelix transcription factor ASIL2-like isoform X2 [Tripterygium wilfordii]